MNEIELRLARLRELMKREHLSAFIFPSTDAHQSEYVADHWRGREWISGFNGSVGTAVVTNRLLYGLIPATSWLRKNSWKVLNIS